MKIHDDHMYHGAALIQVAEHKNFTAINALKVGKITHRNSYKINDKIALHIKYATNKIKPSEEYVFTFSKQHLNDLKSIHKVHPKTFVALVCVKDREICCLSYSELRGLVKARKLEKGSKEDQYTVLVTTPPRKQMRVYVNSPGKKGRTLGSPMLVKRSDFPSKIFG